MKLTKSYARRVGKTLSNTSKNILANELSQYQFDKNLINSYFAHSKVALEIGFGMGDHFIHQLSCGPSTFYIGAEVYTNGVAKVLKTAIDTALNNFVIWPDDIDLILGYIPDTSLDIIYILFPDPWPKTRQKKKRLLNQQRLNILYSKLKNTGILQFASDISDYYKEVKNIILSYPNITFQEYIFPDMPSNYLPTKYHKKAIIEGRIPQFLIAVKN